MGKRIKKSVNRVIPSFEVIVLLFVLLTAVVSLTYYFSSSDNLLSGYQTASLPIKSTDFTSQTEKARDGMIKAGIQLAQKVSLVQVCIPAGDCPAAAPTVTQPVIAVTPPAIVVPTPDEFVPVPDPGQPPVGPLQPFVPPPAQQPYYPPSSPPPGTTPVASPSPSLSPSPTPPFSGETPTPTPTPDLTPTPTPTPGLTLTPTPTPTPGVSPAQPPTFVIQSVIVSQTGRPQQTITGSFVAPLRNYFTGFFVNSLRNYFTGFFVGPTGAQTAAAQTPIIVQANKNFNVKLNIKNTGDEGEIPSGKITLQITKKDGSPMKFLVPKSQTIGKDSQQVLDTLAGGQMDFQLPPGEYILKALNDGVAVITNPLNAIAPVITAFFSEAKITATKNTAFSTIFEVKNTGDDKSETFVLDARIIDSSNAVKETASVSVAPIDVGGSIGDEKITFQNRNIPVGNYKIKLIGAKEFATQDLEIQEIPGVIKITGYKFKQNDVEVSERNLKAGLPTRFGIALQNDGETSVTITPTITFTQGTGKGIVLNTPQPLAQTTVNGNGAVTDFIWSQPFYMLPGTIYVVKADAKDATLGPITFEEEKAATFTANWKIIQEGSLIGLGSNFYSNTPFTLSVSVPNVGGASGKPIVKTEIKDSAGTSAIVEETNSPANDIAPGESYSFERKLSLSTPGTGYKLIITVDGKPYTYDLPEVKEAMAEIIVSGGFTITQPGEAPITGSFIRNLLTGNLISEERARELENRISQGKQLTPKQQEDLDRYKIEKSKPPAKQKIRKDKPIDIKITLSNSGNKETKLTNPRFVLTKAGVPTIELPAKLGNVRLGSFNLLKGQSTTVTLVTPQVISGLSTEDYKIEFKAEADGKPMTISFTDTLNIKSADLKINKVLIVPITPKVSEEFKFNINIESIGDLDLPLDKVKIITKLKNSQAETTALLSPADAGSTLSKGSQKLVTSEILSKTSPGVYTYKIMYDTKLIGGGEGEFTVSGGAKVEVTKIEMASKVEGVGFVEVKSVELKENVDFKFGVYTRNVGDSDADMKDVKVYVKGPFPSPTEKVLAMSTDKILKPDSTVYIFGTETMKATQGSYTYAIKYKDKDIGAGTLIVNPAAKISPEFAVYSTNIYLSRKTYPGNDQNIIRSGETFRVDRSKYTGFTLNYDIDQKNALADTAGIKINLIKKSPQGAITTISSLNKPFEQGKRFTNVMNTDALERDISKWPSGRYEMTLRAEPGNEFFKHFIETFDPVVANVIDLVPISLNVPNSVAIGSEFNLEYVVKNKGNTDSKNAFTRFFLVTSTGQEVLVSGGPFNVKADKTETFKIPITVPNTMQPGIVKLKVVIDSEKSGGESDYSNNVLISNQFTLSSGSPAPVPPQAPVANACNAPTISCPAGASQGTMCVNSRRCCAERCSLPYTKERGYGCSPQYTCAPGLICQLTPGLTRDGLCVAGTATTSAPVPAPAPVSPPAPVPPVISSVTSSGQELMSQTQNKGIAGTDFSFNIKPGYKVVAITGRTCSVFSGGADMYTYMIQAFKNNGRVWYLPPQTVRPPSYGSNTQCINIGNMLTGEVVADQVKITLSGSPAQNADTKFELTIVPIPATQAVSVLTTKSPAPVPVTLPSVPPTVSIPPPAPVQVSEICPNDCEGAGSFCSAQERYFQGCPQGTTDKGSVNYFSNKYQSIIKCAHVCTPTALTSSQPMQNIQSTPATNSNFCSINIVGCDSRILTRFRTHIIQGIPSPDGKYCLINNDDVVRRSSTDPRVVWDFNTKCGEVIRRK